MNKTKPDTLLKVAAIVGVLFGLLTIASGARTLFGAEAQREAGAYVPFVLWFNFGAGFAYVLAGVGLWMRRRGSAQLAAAIVLATLVVFAAFGIRVLAGGAYESRTTVAMTLRAVVWAGIAWAGWRSLARGT